MLSFSFPSICENVLAGTGNQTFAAVKLNENYDHLKAAFDPVLMEMNETIEQKEVLVHHQPVTLDIVFGSDLKVCVI